MSGVASGKGQGVNIRGCIGVLLALVLGWMPVSIAWAEDALAAEIQTLLQSGRHPQLHWGRFSDVAKTLEQLYSPAYAPVWFRDGKATVQARAILESLAGADDLGLNASDYDVEWLGQQLQAPELKADNPRTVAAFDVGLSIAVTRFVTNVSSGRINPRTVGFGLNVEPRRLDVSKRVREIAQSPQAKALVATLEPQFPMYRPLKEALLRYRQLAKELPHVRFGFPAKFTPGMSHKDVPALRKLLLAVGDLKSIDPAVESSELYDPDLAKAVKAFQIRHGLGDDAVIGKGTLARLSTPIADRLKQIQIGLERMRWLPSDVRGHYLIVNIPSYRLYGARAGDGIGHYDLSMNVVVGQAIDGRNTPVFHSDMSMVTFRPYWNVPEGIAAKELVPDILKNPKYLQKHAMEIVPNFSLQATPLEPSPSNLQRVAAGALKIRQRPGGENALGLVKFSFPNTNNVYLHSTPSKGLFNRDRRDFSHGCIRVQDPEKLAEWVLADNGDWPPERIKDYMEGEATKTITLKKPIPVYILYSTVMAEPDGTISFFEDIYGHDRTLQVLLARGFPYPP